MCVATFGASSYCSVSFARTKCCLLSAPSVISSMACFTFLGHMISPAGVAPDPSKVSAIRDMVASTDVSHLHSFLGCTNFYERFVPHYATICSPLTDLLGSNVEWYWGRP